MYIHIQSDVSTLQTKHLLFIYMTKKLFLYDELIFLIDELQCCLGH